MPTELLAPAHWAHNFVIADADQPVAPILGILETIRNNQWIVLFREADRRITGYFPFRKRELKRRLPDNAILKLAAEVLELPLQGATPVEQRAWRLPRPEMDYPERFRPVLLGQDGTVSAIGVVQESFRKREYALSSSKDSGAVLEESSTFEALRPIPQVLRIEDHEKPRPYPGDPRDPRLIEFAGATVSEDASPPTSTNSSPDELIVPVFYATDRKPERSSSEAFVRYTNERSNGDVSLGLCSVSIPRVHKIGRLEKPARWKIWARPERKKHIIILSTVRTSGNEFYRALSLAAAESVRKDAFIFIHGYNVNFETAAIRTAQLAADLGFQGAPILFSWPSKASLAGYLSDEGTIQWSRPHLSAFITELRLRTHVEAIHLIAHSMGSRALLEVLNTLSLESLGNLRFKQLVLAAPDIDAGVFQQLEGNTTSICERVTLYASSNDKALAFSKTIHSFARAGEAGPNLLVLGALDTIDASSVDTDFLGHSLFVEERPIIEDMFYLLAHGHPPDDRFGLEAKTGPQGAYWSFKH